MHTLANIRVGRRSGVVFFDDFWDAYGWRTCDFTNGPFDTQDEAEEALRDELCEDDGQRILESIGSFWREDPYLPDLPIK
jgi:hypothetical protein